MSDLTENEILDRHVTSLREAKDHCVWLNAQRADGMTAPRGGRYVRLRKALSELEGSCRQMAHFRGDARWLRLGVIYGRAMPLAQAKYISQSWKSFGQMVAIFDKGLRSADELANRKTHKFGLILPERASDWLVFPEWRPYGGAA